MDQQLIKKAKEIIEEVTYISLATVNTNNQPWNTPLITIHDARYNFYWRSAKDAIHSKNINNNSTVFIIIYNTQAIEWDARQAVYIQAKTTELTDENEINTILPLLDKKSGVSFGKTEKYLKEYPRRIYKAVPKKVWINVNGIVGRVFVDKRVEIKLV